MKIAILCYPDVSFNDLTAFLTPFEQLRTSEPECCSWEFCSFLPLNNHAPGLSLTCSRVGLPLHGFDLIVVPGSAKNFAFSQEWGGWLKSADPQTPYLGINNGLNLLKENGIEPLLTPRIDLPLNAFIAGLLVIHQNFSEESAYGIAKSLGLLSVWNVALTRMGRRYARFSRSSAETQIEASLLIDGTGLQNIDTGIPFLDHMLSQIAKHGLFDIEMLSRGDLEIDPHHTMEDTALAFGELFRLALDDRRGINRMGFATVPMDESLASVTIDFSGRPYSVIRTKWNGDKIADLPVSLFEHFLESFASSARCNLFVQVQAGNDNHHMAEAIFKSLARALDQATIQDVRRSGQIPSTKEVLF